MVSFGDAPACSPWQAGVFPSFKAVLPTLALTAALARCEAAPAHGLLSLWVWCWSARLLSREGGRFHLRLGAASR